jgi:hypothetical protein
MKTKNFPAKKLKRQLRAKGLNEDDYKQEIDNSRNKRTKKRRI